MSNPDAGVRTSSSASSLSTERSALLKQPDLKAVYGTDTSRSDSDYGSSESSSLLSRSGDEEASIDSNVTPAEAEGVETHEVLSSKAIMWIVLPMLLGESRSGTHALRLWG